MTANALRPVTANALRLMTANALRPVTANAPRLMTAKALHLVMSTSTVASTSPSFKIYQLRLLQPKPRHLALESVMQKIPLDPCREYHAKCNLHLALNE